MLVPLTLTLWSKAMCMRWKGLPWHCFQVQQSPNSFQSPVDFWVFQFREGWFLCFGIFAEKDLPLNLEPLNWRGWSPTCRQLGPLRLNSFEEFRSNAETWCALPILRGATECRSFKTGPCAGTQGQSGWGVATQSFVVTQDDMRKK